MCLVRLVPSAPAPDGRNCFDPAFRRLGRLAGMGGRPATDMASWWRQSWGSDRGQADGPLNRGVCDRVRPGVSERDTQPGHALRLFNGGRSPSVRRNAGFSRKIGTIMKVPTTGGDMRARADEKEGEDLMTAIDDSGAGTAPSSVLRSTRGAAAGRWTWATARPGARRRDGSNYLHPQTGAEALHGGIPAEVVTARRGAGAGSGLTRSTDETGTGWCAVVQRLRARLDRLDPQTGANVVHGRDPRSVGEDGVERLELHDPVTDETGMLVGLVSLFEGGSIEWMLDGGPSPSQQWFPGDDVGVLVNGRGRADLLLHLQMEHVDLSEARGRRLTRAEP